ncbi:MAG: TetR/AcrR family transcriptional regulator [Parasphingorhabdus sp.]
MSESPWKSELHWRLDGRQDRSSKTQNKLLDAAESLFFLDGYDATSVADIAKKSGCSIGAVYHHFKDKKAIAFALFDRMTSEYAVTANEACSPERWTGATIVDILKGYIHFSIVNNRERPGFKIAALEAVRLDPSLGKHFQKLQIQLHKGLQKLLLERRDEIGHPDPTFASAYALDLLTALLRVRFDPAANNAQLTKLNEKEFRQHAISLCLSVLQIERKITS